MSKVAWPTAEDGKLKTPNSKLQDPPEAGSTKARAYPKLQTLNPKIEDKLQTLNSKP